MDVLDDIPLASLTFVAGLIIIIIAYALDDISLPDALEAVGFVGVGSGVIGVARNQAGRGLRKP